MCLDSINAPPWNGWSQPEADNAHLDGNGHLVLEVTPGTKGTPYNGARIQGWQNLARPLSDDKIRHKLYPPCRIEAAIQTCGVGGFKNEFWAITVQADDKPYAYYEHDGMEFRMAWPKKHEMHVHGLKEGGTSKTLPFDPKQAFHVYGWDYFGDKCVFRVDGVTYWTSPTLSPPRTMPISLILVNFVAAPTTWHGQGGPPPAGTPLPQKMLVDYVRATPL